MAEGWVSRRGWESWLGKWVPRMTSADEDALPTLLALEWQRMWENIEVNLCANCTIAWMKFCLNETVRCKPHIILFEFHTLVVLEKHNFNCFLSKKKSELKKKSWSKHNCHLLTNDYLLTWKQFSERILPSWVRFFIGPDEIDRQNLDWIWL